ncbi:MAG: biotin-dependent carboxyltransferase family protein [Acidimicrobiales bacterium]
MTGSATIEVAGCGPVTTLQDLGRRGVACYGVAASGAADRGSLRLVNRLVGNEEAEAAIEVLAGNIELRVTAGTAIVAVAGGSCAVTVDGREDGMNAPLELRAGSRLHCGAIWNGIRAYVAVRGGLDVPPVMGSRSYDTLGRIGPAPLRAGDVLKVAGRLGAEPAWHGPAPVRLLPELPTLRISPGPRYDWLAGEGRSRLSEARWLVSPDSDRIGIRLDGPRVPRRSGELLSEPVIPGAVQLSTAGQPILLGPDCGVTGGYPVVGVMLDADLDLAGQLAPGSRVLLHWHDTDNDAHRSEQLEATGD